MMDREKTFTQSRMSKARMVDLNNELKEDVSKSCWLMRYCLMSVEHAA